MGVYDQGARFAAHAEPTGILQRLLKSRGLSLSFRGWEDTRTLPLPGGPDRTADLVVALDEPTTEAAVAEPTKVASPWLMIMEFQAQVDVEKLDGTLEEVAILRHRVRHGKDSKEKYKVLVALVYLQGRCPEDVLDMTLPDGSGTRHAPLIWNVAEDDAAQTVEAVAAGQLSCGLLFWIALMAGGGDDKLIKRWKEVVTATVSDGEMRGNLAGISLVFADLAGHGLAWKQELEGWQMTESKVVNEWISQGVAKTRVEERRMFLIELLEMRFPAMVPAEIFDLIGKQDSPDLLHDWFRAAGKATTFEQLLNVLKR
jgi:hypothetical protein